MAPFVGDVTFKHVQHQVCGREEWKGKKKVEIVEEDEGFR
jgi:hypothetical protein